MKTCREAAREWGMAERTVSGLCATHKIPGAVKKGKSWQLPDDARKPIDGRIKTGKYMHPVIPEKRRAFPIGISDYVRAQSEYYYVDKTLLIKEFLDKKPLVSLFIRPHRFGKTLNMDMLRVFFEISKEDTGRYFKDKAIWECGEKYTGHQGKYPVIFLNFKDVKGDSWEVILEKLAGVLQAEFARHGELQQSKRLASCETDFFSKILQGRAAETELSTALEALSRMLDEHYGVSPIILIDEYDTPLQQGDSCSYYQKLTGFMQSFFSGGFKDNRHLSYGFLSGVWDFSQDEIFDGLPNLAVSSMLDDDYSSSFGFTAQEVNQLLRHYGLTDKQQELQSWYGGYLLGNQEIYHPWSVFAYLSKDCIPRPYWGLTGKSEILKKVPGLEKEGRLERLYLLLQGKRVTSRIYPGNEDSCLLSAGFLKALDKEQQEDGAYLCRISIPDKEIATLLQRELIQYFLQTGMITQGNADKILESLFANDLEKLQMAIAEYLDYAISNHNYGAEDFYYAFTLGLTALLSQHYEARADRDERSDCFSLCLYPRKRTCPGMILILKSENGLTEERLKNLAREAVGQIAEKGYEQQMKQHGVTRILRIGTAFSGKKVKIKFE